MAERYFRKESFPVLAASESRHWWFRARNKLILWMLSAKVGPFHSLLDLGCGTGFVLEAIHAAYPEADLHGSDYFAEGIAFARQRVPSAEFRQIDARDLDDCNRFDVVCALDVIEHIRDDDSVLANIEHALKPGGTLLLTVPQHRWLWSVVDERACHERRYSRLELLGKVEQAGLRPLYVSSFVCLLLPLMWISRRRANLQQDGAEAAEFSIGSWTNWILERVMDIERRVIQLGLRLPVGGSLLMVCRRPATS